MHVGYISAEFRYPSQPSDPFLNDQAKSLPPSGFHGSICPTLNGTGMDDDEDYDIQYIERKLVSRHQIIYILFLSSNNKCLMSSRYDRVQPQSERS